MRPQEAHRILDFQTAFFWTICLLIPAHHVWHVHSTCDGNSIWTQSDSLRMTALRTASIVSQARSRFCRTVGQVQMQCGIGSPILLAAWWHEDELRMPWYHKWPIYRHEPSAYANKHTIESLRDPVDPLPILRLESTEVGGYKSQEGCKRSTETNVSKPLTKGLFFDGQVQLKSQMVRILDCSRALCRLHLPWWRLFRLYGPGYTWNRPRDGFIRQCML